ncbi:stAR-related lipid transfer protein 13 isoform X2 [Tachysurus ichikawai]
MFKELPEAESSECLASMTPETQDIYLRMDHHRRRSGYRLGRIIARQQLLRKIAAGIRVGSVRSDVLPSTLLSFRTRGYFPGRRNRAFDL